MPFAFAGSSSLFFSRGRAINTQIICILLNGGHSSRQFVPRTEPAEKCIPFGETLVHQYADFGRSDTYELTASYIRKNISVGVYAYVGAITNAMLHAMQNDILR